MNVANLVCLELGLWIYEDIMKIILLIIMFKRLDIKLACHLLGLKILVNNDLREVVCPFTRLSVRQVCSSFNTEFY